MNSHLKYVASEYEGKQIQGVWPISSVDCEIITTLIKLLEAKGEHKAVRILNNYKKVADTDTLDALMQVLDIALHRSAKADNYVGEEDEDDNYGAETPGKSEYEGPTYVIIKDIIIKVGHLKTIKTTDSYDTKGGIYSVVVNKGYIDEDETSFRSEKARARVIQELKQKLIDYENCKFI